MQEPQAGRGALNVTACPTACRSRTEGHHTPGSVATSDHNRLHEQPGAQTPMHLPLSSAFAPHWLGSRPPLVGQMPAVARG